MIRKVVVVMGEPGAGKSIILSSLVGFSAFATGPSLGVGLTSTSVCVERDGVGYIDTPGLQDVSAERRALAAREITMSLRMGGVVCKLLFVVDCGTGRIRSNEKETIELVLEALPKKVEFSVICNKVPSALLERFRSSDKELLVLYFTINGTRPQNVFSVPFNNEYEANGLIERTEIERLHLGISLLSWSSLDLRVVKSVKQEVDEVGKAEILSRFQRLEKLSRSQLAMRSQKLTIAKAAQFWLDLLNQDLKIAAGVGGFMNVDDDDVSMRFWSTFPDRAGGIFRLTNDRFLSIFTVLNPSPNFGFYILDQHLLKEDKTSHFTFSMFASCVFGNFDALEYLIEHVVTSDSLGVLRSHYLALSNNKKMPLRERGFCLRKSQYYSTLDVNDCDAQPVSEIHYMLWSAAFFLGILRGNLQMVKNVYKSLPAKFDINQEMDYCIPVLESIFLAVKQRSEELGIVGPKKVLLYNLHYCVELACLIGQLDVLSFLLDQGAKPTPHCFAVADAEGADLLLKARPLSTLSFDKETGLSELHAACLSGDFAVVGKIYDAASASLESGSATSTRCITLGATPLLVACAAGKLRVVQYLFSLGAQLSVTDLLGRGVFHYAALFSVDKHVATWLLKFCKRDGYDFVDKLGRTPIHYAAAVGNYEILWLFLSQDNSQANAVDCNGFSALHYATLYEHIECVTALIKFEADCTLVRSHMGFGPDLAPESFGCHLRMVPRVELLDYLCSLRFENLKEMCEKTSVSVQPDDTKIFLAHKYYRSCILSGCGSPVHIAALNGDIESLKVMERLLGKRLSLDAHSGYPLYLSPVHFAVLSRDLECVKFLLERSSFKLILSDIIDLGFNFSLSHSASDGFQLIFPELLCCGGAFRVYGGLTSISEK